MRNIARLHQSGDDATLPAAVARVLKLSMAEVEALFVQALGDGEG